MVKDKNLSNMGTDEKGDKIRCLAIGLKIGKIMTAGP